MLMTHFIWQTVLKQLSGMNAKNGAITPSLTVFTPSTPLAVGVLHVRCACSLMQVSWPRPACTRTKHPHRRPALSRPSPTELSSECPRSHSPPPARTAASKTSLTDRVRSLVAARPRRPSNMQLRTPRLRLKQKRSAYRRRQQSDRPLRKSSERRRRSASGRSL